MSTSNAGNESGERFRPATRRTVVKGAAWSVPIVAVGMAAPSAVASEGSGCDPAAVLTGMSIDGPGAGAVGLMCHETSPNNTYFYPSTTSICYSSVFVNNTSQALAAGTQQIELAIATADGATTSLTQASVPISAIGYHVWQGGADYAGATSYGPGASIPTNATMVFTITGSIPAGGTVTFTYCTQWTSVNPDTPNGCPQDGSFPFARAMSPCSPTEGGTNRISNNQYFYNNAYADVAAVRACNNADIVPCP